MKKIFIGIAILAITVSLINAETSQNSSAKNDKATFEKYKKSADQNNSESIYNLGVLYANGQGVKKDMKMAHDLFLQSANMGYARAQYNMGVFNFKGILDKKYYGKALKWFDKAAKQNIPEALYVMGSLYEEGKGTKKDIKKALGYYLQAAVLREQRALKRMKEEPLLLKKIFEWDYKNNAPKKYAGQNSPKGIYNLGVRYANGENVKKDMKMAHKLFLKSANMGNARAQYNMGVLYPKVVPVKQDNQKSLKWLEMASQQNLREAIYMMGRLYEEGREIKKDIKKALGYYVRAADLGEKRALERIKKEPLLKKDLKLREKGTVAAKKSNHRSAIEYFKKSLIIRKKVLGERSLHTADTYINLAYSYKQIRDYPRALEYYQKDTIIREKIWGKEHPDTAESYNNIGGVYELMGNHPKALQYYQKSLTIRKKVLGEEHTETAESYGRIGLHYQSNGNYHKALKYFQKSLAIYEKVMGKVSFGTALMCHNIGETYESMGDYHKAFKYYQKSLRIWKKIRKPSRVTSGDGDTDYKGYSLLRQFKGDHHKALKYYQKSLVRKEKVLGKDHLDTGTLYNNIGLVYQSSREHSKALKYYQKALAIYEKVMGEGHSDTATIYNNIGKYYQSTEDYRKALEYSQKALAVREKVLGIEHIDTAVNNYIIGSIYELTRDYDNALEYHTKALAVRERLPFSNSAIASYDSIISIYKSMGNHYKALEYYQKSLSLHEGLHKIDHPLPRTSYKNIAELNGSGYSLEALKRYQKYLPTYEKVLGKGHPDIATSYNNIGYIYFRMRDNPTALKNYQKSLAIYKKVLGKEHPDTANCYHAIGRVYNSMQDYHKSYHYNQLAFNVFLINRDRIFTILDSKQKEKYLKDKTMYIRLLLSTSCQYIQQLNKENKSTKSKQILHSGANAWLNYKGSIFDSENAIAMLYSSTKDKKLKVKIDDLVSSKRYLARLYQSLPKPKEKEAWKSNIKKTEDKIAKITNQIASKATNFKEQQGLKSIRYQDITSHLKDNELYIDYAKVGEHYYLFSLDHKENISFIQIDKNSTKKIDGLVKAFREDINIILKDNTITDEKLKTLTQSSKAKLSKLYELIIQKPLGETIKDKTSLIISPDGALRLLPFETLYSKESDKYFIEEKEIRYIPSGKELVRLYKYSKEKVSMDKRSAVIFANPNFDSDLNSSKRVPITITPNTSRTAIIKPLFMIEFPSLPGTKAEAKAIKSTFAEGSTIEYLQDDATESNLTKVKQPNILHIATHGFFINDNTIPNPMLKSGIALTGANKSRIKGVGDGIVTALKLSGLDLKGTDLVVLSACQTGVVDINSTDSVSGLSKAFIQAGAKDIVMSLWSVDDEATKELMSSFYQEMKENKNYAKALKSAKLKMIEEGRHPFYWGAFVVSGL